MRYGLPVCVGDLRRLDNLGAKEGMKSAAAIVVDGVLRKPVGGTPIREGLSLYAGLCAAYNVVLLRTGEDDAEFDHFLVSENLYSHSNVFPWIITGGADDVTRSMQVSRIRNSGYAVELVVEPNPVIAAALLHAGFNVLHFMHAAYARPDWRPDFKSEQRPWDELVSEQQRVAKLRAADNRVGSAE
jgi:hypothetical protein